MKKKLKTIPDFKNEDEEREFWSTHSSVDYLDWDNAVVVKFPNLRPSTETISLRMPITLLEDIKISANKKDVPYQSLIKIMLDRAIREEKGEIPRPSYDLIYDKPKKVYTTKKDKKSYN